MRDAPKTKTCREARFTAGLSVEQFIDYGLL
jgi:hypothetical protein